MITRTISSFQDNTMTDNNTGVTNELNSLVGWQHPWRLNNFTDGNLGQYIELYWEQSQRLKKAILLTSYMTGRYYWVVLRTKSASWKRNSLDITYVARTPLSTYEYPWHQSCARRYLLKIGTFEIKESKSNVWQVFQQQIEQSSHGFVTNCKIMTRPWECTRQNLPIWEYAKSTSIV